MWWISADRAVLQGGGGSRAVSSRRQHVGYAIIGATIALAAVLRFYGLARQSAWADEITTLFITDPSLSFGQFWDLMLSDVHPPLYYLLLRGWSEAFGQSDFVARLPSAIAGVLTVAAVSVAFRPLVWPGRIVLMLFLAISPGAIEYAQEARSYALLLLWSTIITGACLRFIACGESDRREAQRAMTILSLFGLLASYTHYFGFLVALAACAVMFVASRHDRRRAAMAAIGGASVVALFLPWVIYHSHYMSYGLRQADWIAEFPASATAEWFLRLWLGGMPALAVLGAVVGVLLSVADFRAFVSASTNIRVGLCLPLLTLAAALVISWHKPIITSRNLVVVLPALYLVMSALAVYVASRAGRLFTSTFVAAMLLFMARPLPWQYTGQTKEQWRESSAFVLAQPKCEEGPIHVYGDVANYRYLVGKAKPRLRLIEIPWGGAARFSLTSPSDCAVILWAADLSRSEFDQVLHDLGLRQDCLRVVAFYGAFVALRPESPCSA